MSDPGTSGQGYPRWAGLSNDTSDYNKIEFVVRQFAGRMHTATIVRVEKCTNTDTVVPAVSVDVTILVNLVNGLLESQPHKTIYGIPYLRLQGGPNAIIADPAVGDIGICVFAERDISAVKNAKDRANPGSRRRFDYSDGMYLGGILNAAPTQWLRFDDKNNGIDGKNGAELVDLHGNRIGLNDDGIKITDCNSVNTILLNAAGISVTDDNNNSAVMSSSGIALHDKNGNAIVMDSAGVTINGVLIDRSSNMSGIGTATASGEGTFAGHTVGQHTHGGVTTGSGTTATPMG